MQRRTNAVLFSALTCLVYLFKKIEVCTVAQMYAHN